MEDLERERLALQVFGDVCALPPAERAASVEALCGHDPLLRRRVESLLGADEHPTALLSEEADVGGFLDAEVRRVIRAGVADAEELTPPSGRVPSHYRILRVLGEGGMATVYEAEQVHPRRLVAIKVIRGGIFSAELRRRFEYEAQVLAGLQHPGIARLYEAETRHEHDTGSPGLQCYLAMELVRGLPIDEYAAALKLTTGEILALVLRVCDAVEYAHRQGVMHRDLKPGNILVEPGGQPKVLDFGVARAIDRDGRSAAATFTHAGQLVGTLPYMSPEQVDPRLGTADSRCDVYALGVLLYKLLTGVLPIDVSGDGIATAAGRICSEEPMKIGSRDRRLRGDLEVIVAKAIAKDPARRYRGVDALAEDLRRFLDGRAIEARADSHLYVLRKTAWRLRRTVATAAVAVVLIIAAAVNSQLHSEWNRRLAEEATQSRDASVAAMEMVEVRARDLRRSLYLSHIGFAQSAIGTNDVARARELLDACPADLRGWEWQYLQNTCDLSESVRPLGQRVPSAVDASADQARDAIGTATGDAFVINTSTGETLLERGFERGSPVAVAISPDGSKMAGGALMEELCVIDLAAGKDLWKAKPAPPPKFHLLKRLRALRFSQDGRLLASAGYDGHVRLCDAATGKDLRDIDAHCLSVLCLAFTRDGRMIAGGDNEGTVRMWRVADGVVLHESRGHDESVGAVAMSPDDRLLASGGGDGRVVVRSMADWSESASLHVGENIVWSLAFSPDGSTLAVGTDDNVVRVWRPGAAAPAAVLRGHSAPVNFVSFDHDGRHLTSAAADGTLRRWNLDHPGATPAITPGNTMVYDAAFTPDGTGVLAACNDGTVRLWDARTLAERWRQEGVMTAVRSVAVDARSNLAATADHTGAVRLIDLAEGHLADTITADDSTNAVAVAFQAEGKRVAAAYGSGRVCLWDVAGRRQVAGLAAHDGGATSLAFAPDGTLATGGNDGRVKLWTRDGAAVLATAAAAPVRALRFAPGGLQLAAAREDGSITLYDSASLQPLRELRGHVGAVVGLAFHPGGNRLASGGADRTIRLWDLSGGEQLVTLRGHLRQVNGLAFSPDGSTLASASADRTVRLWDGAPRNAGDARK